MVKKLLYISLAVLVASLVVYLGVTYDPCKKASDLIVAAKGLNCVMEVLDRPTAEIREEACIYLGKEPGCSFNEDDREGVRKFIDDKVNTCIKKKLRAENFCTDNLPEMNL